MLEKAFQKRFFESIEDLSEVDLGQKIEAVQTASKGFERGSEAALDAKFMMRHMRRIRAERLFSHKAVTKQ